MLKEKLSECGKFRSSPSGANVLIIEALENDWWDWGNYEEQGGEMLPAFLAYFGFYTQREAMEFAHWLQTIASEVQLRKARRLKGEFDWELKVRGLSREQLDHAILKCYWHLGW